MQISRATDNKSVVAQRLHRLSQSVLQLLAGSLDRNCSESIPTIPNGAFIQI